MAPASARSPPPASSPSCGRRRRGGFGGKVNVGKIDDIIAGIATGSGFFYDATARSWVTAVPVGRPAEGRGGATTSRILAGMADGIVALYQKCPHLGCRVPQCVSSQWFECPCHGSQYNQVGEKKGGPAPRGMDRFAVTVDASGDVVDRHRHRRPGPADRHQHHRPGGRGPALHHRRRWQALMIALWRSPRPPSRWIIFAVILVGWIVYYFAQPRRGAHGARLGDRAGAQPQAVLRRRGAGGQAPRARAARRRAAARRDRHRPAAVLGARARAARPAPRSRHADTVRRVGRAICSSRRPNGGFNCAGCHGGMKATGGNAPYTVTDPPTGEVTRGQLVRAGAQHRALPLQPTTRCSYILTYGRPCSPMSAWGLDGGGPMNAQQIADAHRLPRDASRSPARTAQTEEADDPELPDRPPAEPSVQQEIETLARRSRRQTATLRHATARRCSTSTSTAAPTAAPAATPRAGATASPASAARARSAGTSPAGPRTRHFPQRSGHDRLRPERLGERRRLRHAVARARGRMPGFGALLTDEQIQAIVEYVRSL